MSHEHRIIVRHKGAKGDGVPEGGEPGQILSVEGWVNPPNGTGAVVGPTASVNNNIAAFSGLTGKLIKDSGVSVDNLASATAVNLKVDKVAGKGLSTEDFTTALKAKLEAATAENYRGQYVTKLALTTAVPAGFSGDYALVGTADSLALYVWDTTGSMWVSVKEDALTGRDIVDLVFNDTDAATWSKNNSFIFTEDLRERLSESASLEYVNSLALAAGLLSPAYGQIYYFDLTGSPVQIDAASDGVTNLVKVNPITTLDSSSVGFDSPVSSRIRYIGDSNQNFAVTFDASFSAPSSVTKVIGLAKNGSIIASTKVIQGSISQIQSISSSAIVSLATNDFLEVYVGNTTSSADATVHALAIKAHAV